MWRRRGLDFFRLDRPERTDVDIPKNIGVRAKINDARIEGPFETGWGFKDFEDQHSLVGLPNPLKE
jgi:hypothetical protein